MIKFEHTEVVGWEHAIRGMRNPLNSWEKSDSCWKYLHEEGVDEYECIGPNDLDLMKRLVKAGTDHRKFMRMIVVYADITAPLYWWKEYDTYKVGTVANSCSTMHKIHEREFTLKDFSHEHLISFSNHNKDERLVPTIKIGEFRDVSPLGMLKGQIKMLNVCRERYLAALKTQEETGFSAKNIWYQMIQLLPNSYNQKRTVMLNYEVLANIYKSRRNHKLDEWVELCKWIETLPYSELIAGKMEDV